jgi:hypothetical protein
MSFIKTPDIFWNRANTKIRQVVQLLLFPNGIVYDFETGFGTAEKIKSYLLIEKIADKTAKNSDLVNLTGLRWNTLYESTVELDHKLEGLGLMIEIND